MFVVFVGEMFVGEMFVGDGMPVLDSYKGFRVARLPSDGDHLLLFSDIHGLLECAVCDALSC